MKKGCFFSLFERGDDENITAEKKIYTKFS